MCLRKHEKMWSAQLAEINATKMRINLVADAKQFKSASYRAGPKTRELERENIDKQLKAGVIERDMSEWASPVLFVPNEENNSRFFIYYRNF